MFGATSSGSIRLLCAGYKKVISLPQVPTQVQARTKVGIRGHSPPLTMWSEAVGSAEL